MWQRGADEADGVHEVDVETGLPVLLGVGNGEGTDIRHRHVQAAERLGRLPHPARESLSVADVDGCADHEVRADWPETVTLRAPSKIGAPFQITRPSIRPDCA